MSSSFTGVTGISASTRSAASIVRCILAGALGVLPALGAATGQASRLNTSSGVESYLRSVGLGTSELRAAERGRAVAVLLNTEDSRDVAVFGMIRVRASRDAVVAHVLGLRGIVVTGASRFGVFGDPPVGTDVRSVAFDRSEYKGLRNCRPGDCDFKMSADAMKSFLGNVDWSSPNARRQADSLLRAQLLHLVADYRQRGNAAMPTYNDGNGVRAADAFAAVTTQFGQTLAKDAPALFAYLTSYPLGRPQGAHEFVYWSEERRGRMRPTLTVNHVVAHAPPHANASIVRKQIYANHYLEAGLELFTVVDGGMPDSAYLIAVRRFRFDYLPGGILNVRGRVRSQLVEATRSDLTRERAAIERPSIAATLTPR